MIARQAMIVGVLVLLTASVFLLELSVGAVRVPLDSILPALLGGDVEREAWRHIVMDFRLPRAINAAVSGAALGACGLMLQTLFRNPLADPFVLGVSHAARLGVALLVVATGLAGDAFIQRFGIAGDMGLALAASIGAASVMAVLGLLAQRVNNVTLLLSGLMIGYLCVGLISLVMHLIDESQAGAFSAWDDGSFAGATPQQLSILVPAVSAGFVLLWGLSKSLNTLTLGETYALSLGVSVGRVKAAAFAAVALLVGTVTAFCGPITFLGLIAGHLARRLLRSEDHGRLLPVAALIGAALALSTDLITHLPWSRHLLHLNAVNGLLGAPIALYVLLSWRSRVGRST
jgi:iron complex transport system permease protein